MGLLLKFLLGSVNSDNFEVIQVAQKKVQVQYHNICLLLFVKIYQRRKKGKKQGNTFKIEIGNVIKTEEGMQRRIKLGKKVMFLDSFLACNNLISNIFKMLKKFLLERSSNKSKKGSSLEE